MKTSVMCAEGCWAIILLVSSASVLISCHVSDVSCVRNSRMWKEEEEEDVVGRLPIRSLHEPRVVSGERGNMRVPENEEKKKRNRAVRNALTG